jgi:hypothetical protein
LDRFIFSGFGQPIAPFGDPSARTGRSNYQIMKAKETPLHRFGEKGRFLPGK